MNSNDDRQKTRDALRLQGQAMRAKKLLAEVASLGTALDDALRRELKLHPSLLKIVQVDVLPDEGSVQLLERHGVVGYKIHYWKADQEQGTAGGSGGGFMQTLHNEAGEYRTIIFLARKNRGGIEHEDAINNTLNIAVLYHELGHIDDYERGINFSFGKEIDLTKAELYAHHFACRRLKEEGLRMSLAAYLHGISKHFKREHPCQRDSVKELWLSKEFQDYQSYAQPYQHFWPMSAIPAF